MTYIVNEVIQGQLAIEFVVLYMQLWRIRFER